ncbi:Phage exonuclease [Yersinia phage fPS-65]|uniref:Phage exonuclease n=1 Tax=Yersinia phage fPS-65 TaxID=2052931 RepID=A0A449C445_9CAUD|nr:Phage exonuclease [Yersinia phage fPS-65]VEV89142.1 Phage exonuclease [Yersinia phage fPS-65]
MIELNWYQFKSLMTNVKAVIQENPGPENITIREKALKIVYSLEEIQKDIESMAKFIDEPINKVYIQDYTVGQIRDLARKI